MEEGDYEEQRRKAIAARAKMAQQLGIAKKKRKLEEAHERVREDRKRRRVEAKEKKKEEAAAAPRRRSLRVQGLSVEGEPLEYPPRELGMLETGAPERPERPEGDLSLRDACVRDQDATLAETCIRQMVEGAERAPGKAKVIKYEELDIREDHHVLKVVPNRIYSIAFSPIQSPVVIWGGDKWGRLGAFRPHVEEPDQAATVFLPHSRPISGLATSASHPNLLFSCSYDGSIRTLDAERGVFIESLLWDSMFSYVDVVDGGRVLWGSTSAGELVWADRREGLGDGSTSHMKPRGVDVHDRKTCSVSVHPDGHTILTSSLDGTACLWDARKMGGGSKSKRPTPLVIFGHRRGVTSAFFSPSGEKIVSTANDDKLRVWEGGKTAKDPADVEIVHDNHTGRWLSNFRTIWDPRGDDALLIGAMGTREIEFFDASNGDRLCGRSSELLTAVPTLNAFHPTLPLVASGTASGRLHLWS